MVSDQAPGLTGILLGIQDRRREVQGHSRHIQGKHYNNGLWNLIRGEEANKSVRQTVKCDRAGAVNGRSQRS